MDDDIEMPAQLDRLFYWFLASIVAGETAWLWVLYRWLE